MVQVNIAPTVQNPNLATLPRDSFTFIRPIDPLGDEVGRIRKQQILTRIKRLFLFLLVSATAAAIAFGIFAAVTGGSEGSRNSNAQKAKPPKPTQTESAASGPIAVIPPPPDAPPGLDLNSVPVVWYDLTCGSSSLPPTAEANVQRAIAFTNDILVRSDSSLRLFLHSIRNVTAPSNCLLLGHDSLTINKISQNLVFSEADSPNFRHSFKVVRIVTGQEAVSGFSMQGSGISFIRNNEFSKVFAHEFAHAFGLAHPFPFLNGSLDLPPSCTATEGARIALLAKCPIGVRSCRNATVDEAITNLMDYLPESCGRPYVLSPLQVAAMGDYVKSKYL